MAVDLHKLVKGRIELVLTVGRMGKITNLSLVFKTVDVKIVRRSETG